MRGRVFLLAAATICAVAAVTLAWRHGLQHWVAIHTGTDNEPGPDYGFFSGIGSDLGEITLLAAILGVYHRHQCHTGRCWRIGRHVVSGTPFCNRHHRRRPRCAGRWRLTARRPLPLSSGSWTSCRMTFRGWLR